MTTEQKLRETLEFILRGIRAGTILSKPFIIGMGDPDATEYGLVSLEEIVVDALTYQPAPTAEATLPPHRVEEL